MAVKVLYLFTGVRTYLLEKVRKGEDLGNGFWGMLRLSQFGVTAEFLEFEQYLPSRVCTFLRRCVGSYFAHLPFFWKFFSYDIVFTAGAFGSQFVHALLGFKKPLWVMYDFSIMGLLGNETTRRQKIFRFMVSHAAGVVTLSIGEAEKLKKRFPRIARNIAFIPYGVDLTFFKPDATTAEEKQVFAPGTDPDRDYQTLFKACEGLGAKVLITTYPFRLKKLPALPAFVQHKRLSIDELREEYARSSVVVIPLDTKSGLNDAMGVSVVYEALAMGKAIVASDTEAMRSYITDEQNGVLVPEGDVNALQRAIQELLDNPIKRRALGKAARVYAEHNLDADKCTQRLAHYFTRIKTESS